MKRQNTKQTKMKTRCALKKVKKERKIWMGTNLSATRGVSCMISIIIRGSKQASHWVQFSGIPCVV